MYIYIYIYIYIYMVVVATLEKISNDNLCLYVNKPLHVGENVFSLFVFCYFLFLTPMPHFQ